MMAMYSGSHGGGGGVCGCDLDCGIFTCWTILNALLFFVVSGMGQRVMLIYMKSNQDKAVIVRYKM